MTGRFLKLKLNPWGLLSAAGTLVCGFTVTGFLGRFWWVFDETSHFRVQYAAGLLALVVVFTMGRRFRWAGIFCCCALVNAVVVLISSFLGNEGVPTTGASLRVVSINVHTENQRYDLVEAFVRQCKPDVLILEEVDETWMQHLEQLRDLLPYSESEPRTDNFGIALFGKLPLTNSEIRYFGPAEVPSVSARVELEGRSVTILGTHPLPPGGAENARSRNDQLMAVAEFARQQTNALVVVGDLNTTPWSHAFRMFVQASGLAEGSRGLGYQPTWPAQFWPLRIPLDHGLASRELRVVSRKLGPGIGSDHLPLVMEIGFAKTERR